MRDKNGSITAIFSFYSKKCCASLDKQTDNDIPIGSQVAVLQIESYNSFFLWKNKTRNLEGAQHFLSQFDLREFWGGIQHIKDPNFI